jgi:hypothetical protein
MKVACRTREDERYFRVIVGPGETVLTFERDIVWNSLRQRRETEPLLYDLGRRTPGPGQAADRSYGGDGRRGDVTSAASNG